MAALLVLAAAFAGCGEKKQSDDIITVRTTKPKPKAPVRMDRYESTTTQTLAGSRLNVSIVREACDTLPMVKDNYGQKFVDNFVRLTICRSDGSVFLERTFTKSSFSSYIDPSYRRDGVLEGFAFDKADKQALRFAASVSLPMTDEYIPISVSVSAQGGITIQRRNTLE